MLVSLVAQHEEPATSLRSRLAWVTLWQAFEQQTPEGRELLSILAANAAQMCAAKSFGACLGFK